MDVLSTFDPLPAPPALFGEMHVDYDQMDATANMQPRINGYTRTRINGFTNPTRINGMTQSRLNGAIHFNHSK